ncbi:MAG: stage V sporulation protein AD [Clostridiales bacterium]|jgi:stage V sporulation protein AD|nr:stage V sporulation protein AD [Clostridiales bacterium]
MRHHIGEQTIRFESRPAITAVASVVGPKEGEGPLGQLFDKVEPDMMAGTQSWEKAESDFARQGIDLAVKRAGLEIKDIQYILAGDLLNQSIGSTFGVRSFERPFFGLFGACSTIGEALALGAMLVDGECADNVAISASSHFCAAERTFRFPLELGVQRPLTSSWTVTGDGCMVISSEGEGPGITAATAGKIIDMGIRDANNMGAAMAPAAADVLVRHFQDLKITPDYYDAIATGDLGRYGLEILKRLMEERELPLGDRATDCGVMIFDNETQDTHAGGSGPACSAVTFASYFYPRLKEGVIRRMLFIPTGALMNSMTSQQGESIPAIAHAIAIESQ